MTYETAISALDAARTGDELIRTLDTLECVQNQNDHIVNENNTMELESVSLE
jgi:hypothetical protein